MNVFSWTVILLLGTLLWPLNIPVMALAFKARLGQQKVPFDPLEYWIRSAVASLGIALLGWVLVLVFYILVAWAGIPEMFSLMIVAIVYLPVAIAFLFWMMAFDEIIEAIGLFLIYLLLPGLLMVLISWIFDLAKRITQMLS